MKKYIYPAIFTKSEDGRYCVNFPDLQGCHTFGRTFKDAFKKATECLELYLVCLAEDKEKYPVASEIDKIKVDKDDIVTYVSADLENAEESNVNKVVKGNICKLNRLNDKRD